MTGEPPSEPSGWELWRWVKQLQSEITALTTRLSTYVTEHAFRTERERQDEKQADLRGDLAQEEAERKEGDAALRNLIEDQRREAVNAKRWAIGTAIALASLMVALVVMLRGFLA